MTTAARGRVRIEPVEKWVRAYLGGEAIADTRRALLVWESPYFPHYYLPAEDVRTDLLVPTGETRRSPSRGDAQLFTIKAGDKEATNAASTYVDSPIDEIRGYYRFDWRSMDSWFEEDEEVFVHPRDPYTRVDIIRSSRHVEIRVNGVKVADTHHPTLLFETGLPTRYYIPKTDVRMDLLTPTDTHTSCPYKGDASYWTLEADGETFTDIVWSYKHPVDESAKIAGLLSFYNEKVDIYVDGELQERPKTHFA
ncbi:MAG: DUF427 domain-containing protein [Acidimicrobiia bacterium]